MAKKLFIKTWGCQMNVYDSDRMADALRPMGYEMGDDADSADLVILNTCHIREKASEKLFSELGRLHRDGKPQQTLAVAGCVAQAEGEEITRRAPYVKMVFGPQTYHLLPEMLAQAEGNNRVINTDFPVESKFDLLPEPQAANGPAAFVSIQEGCDKFCTFCVVPYTRGAEYSRSAAKILAECRHLIAQGVQEISLLGQNVNAWHGEGLDGTTWNLSRLVYALADMDIARIRYTTSHPRDMDDDLIRAHGEIPSLMPYLHLPVQSGSNRILEAMNRKHTIDVYDRIIDRLRTARSDMAFSSDFIVGFPGETDEDHRETMKLVERTNFALAYSFKYSRRPGTPASTMPGQLKEDVKDARLQELQALLWKQQRAFNDSKIGQTMDVLFDRSGKKDGQALGKNAWLQSVHVENGEHLQGRIVPVTITAATQTSLTGQLLHAQKVA
ncbi:MAG: tRNA (N6-isopentenyl adenosine(37)-C2)-methylthiotransferase MiaB [Bdellovibrionales bacterium]